MNVMPIRLFTIQDGEGFVADAFQCPVTGNLIYKASGAPAVIPYEQLSDTQKQRLQKYGFNLLEGSTPPHISYAVDGDIEELLPRQ
ncbi:hypothetical protein [Anoxybacteroides tepidamans]|uniref:hypothetical protein n=1 Tax=Anoxybacteroides tepidamans TaxID=265948 RepID=UPI000486B1F1|nr:hypothetical protein [Anoxybacillus tepidamans]